MSQFCGGIEPSTHMSAMFIINSIVKSCRTEDGNIPGKRKAVSPPHLDWCLEVRSVVKNLNRFSPTSVVGLDAKILSVTE